MGHLEYEIKSLSEFIAALETRVNDNYKIYLYRGQNTDSALIPKIARFYFKKSRLTDEKRMHHEFKLMAAAHLPKEPRSTLESLTIGQHHGLPTRLLDWTENPLTSLYFATKSEPKELDKSVVYVVSITRDSSILLEEIETDIYNLSEIKFFKPSNLIRRIASQDGWLSIHPQNGQGFYNRAEEIKKEGVRITKLSIPRENVKEINETLKKCGVNDYTIFQDLDSLSSTIFEKYKK